MDPKEFKKLAKQLKLPANGDFYGSSYSWHKRHGHAGRNTLSRVWEAAEAAGWKPEAATYDNTPDGSRVGRGDTLVSPEGHVLRISSSYGATAYDNSFSINIKFTESKVSSVGEGKVMKLTQKQLKNIINETVGKLLNEKKYPMGEEDDVAFSDRLAELVDDLEGVRNVQSYPSIGMMTRNAGFVVTMDNGAAFQVTIVQSAGAFQGEEEDEDEDDGSWEYAARVNR